MPEIHELKLWPKFFQTKLQGLKDWEYRSTKDRAFAPGDTVLFREWNPAVRRYTGRVYGPVVILGVLPLPQVDGSFFTHSRPLPLLHPQAAAWHLTGWGPLGEGIEAVGPDGKTIKAETYEDLLRAIAEEVGLWRQFTSGGAAGSGRRPVAKITAKETSELLDQLDARLRYYRAIQSEQALRLMRIAVLSGQTATKRGSSPASAGTSRPPSLPRRCPVGDATTRRTRRHRRQRKQAQSYGVSAKPRHRSRSGRTGAIKQKHHHEKSTAKRARVDLMEASHG